MVTASGFRDERSYWRWVLHEDIAAAMVVGGKNFDEPKCSSWWSCGCRWNTDLMPLARGWAPGSRAGSLRAQIRSQYGPVAKSEIANPDENKPGTCLFA